MASFTLVHGSGQNAASWSRVERVLAARGHRVAAPDLPKRAPGFGLADHAARIAESVAGPDTVVVAHSLCGVFLPLVPRIRECARLVFLAAVIPEPGRSLREQFTADTSMFSPEWIAAGARWFDPSETESLAREFLFHDCDEDTLAWALTTMDLMETRDLVTEQCPLPAWPAVPGTAIVATGDRTLTPEWCRRRSREVLGAVALEVEAGHCPHVSRPDAIADLLEGLA